MSHKADLEFDGMKLSWHGHGEYRATSGMYFENKDTGEYVDYQNAKFQNLSDKGPIPEGLYHFSTRVAGEATAAGTAKHPHLDTREGIEHLHDFVPLWKPGHAHGKVDGWDDRAAAQKYDTDHPGELTDYLSNLAWGHNRVRLTTDAFDHRNTSHRGGFYLHDSTKGYSHGCIEVQPDFFTRLRDYAAEQAKLKGGARSRLYLRVHYPSKTASTYGGTYVPPTKP